jgi:hypothetical protein
MTIGQLGHHIGLHVSVNLEGKTVGGQLFAIEQWVPGIVVGLSALGDYVTIKLDSPVGADNEAHGLFHRKSRGQDMVSIDDPQRIRAASLADVAPGGVPQEIVDLVHAGKTLQALRAYRALNGATLDEARAAIAKL